MLHKDISQDSTLQKEFTLQFKKNEMQFGAKIDKLETRSKSEHYRSTYYKRKWCRINNNVTIRFVNFINTFTRFLTGNRHILSSSTKKNKLSVSYSFIQLGAFRLLVERLGTTSGSSV